jgi:hypothetical protein
MHGRGAHAAGLPHPDRGSPSRRHQHDVRILIDGERGDRLDRRGLSGAWPARDQRQSVDEGAPHRRLLLGRQLGGGRVDLGHAKPHRGVTRDQLAHALGQLGLELRGHPPVDPALLARQVAAADELVDERLVGAVASQHLPERGE